MITIVFRTCLRPDAELAELAAAIPDFVLYKDFAADDGKAISLIEFKSLETLAAWRDHPKPLSAQARGREAFFCRQQHSGVRHAACLFFPLGDASWIPSA